MKKKILIIIFLLLLAALVTFASVFIAQKLSEKSEDTVALAASVDDSMTEKWAEGTITYNGHEYVYNSSLKNYLIMGIDKDGIVSEASNYQDGGQSDAMFIISEDENIESVKIIAINRNAMTPVTMFTEDGQPLGTKEAQLCTQHGFGDGKNYSCSLTVDAVSNLFYQLPIDGYIAINAGAIPSLNAFVGGVEVTVLPGLEYIDADVFSVGNQLTLSDDEAFEYLKCRDISEFESADYRLARQKQYIGTYIPLLRQKIGGNADAAAEFYDSISDYLVTNIDVEDMLDRLSDFEFSSQDMLSVPGQTVTGDDGYEQYIVDDHGLYDLIIQVFYKQVD